jgi:hypothetical protein
MKGWDEPMVNTEKRIMGVGCFAGQTTLARVLDRMMEAYSLGDWRHALGSDGKNSAGCLALRRLIYGGPGIDEQDGREGPEEKIAGFFLGFENQRLNLSVFTRCQGRQYQKYTASLGELKRLRQSRLH